MSLDHVPVIDISRGLGGSTPGTRALAREVDRACEDVGFFVIVGHGIEPSLSDDVFEIGRRFFERPLAEKLAVRKGPAADPTGYFPIADAKASIAAGAPPPNVRETFGIIREDSPSGRSNRWPAEPPELKRVGERYYAQMVKLACTLASIFAQALDLPAGYFDTRVDRHDSVLAVHFFPEQVVEPEPGQLRNHPHTDIGLFTLLRTERMHRPGGLEVQLRDGSWTAVPAVADSYVINIGDTLMRWTNDRWLSNMHRVVNPPRDFAAGNTRMSIPFFFKANYDAVLESIPSCCSSGNPSKYEPITAGQYSDQKFGAVYAKQQYSAAGRSA